MLTPLQQQQQQPQQQTAALLWSSSSTAASSWLPSPRTTGQLFVTGATIGPIVDSLHNQVLLEYHKAPITLDWPSSSSSFGLFLGHHSHLFCSSWFVPPLLGVAYVVLGGVLP